MDKSTINKINFLLIIIIMFGIILVAPWVSMWLSFLSSGLSFLTDMYRYRIIVLFRNLFILGWVIIVIGAILLVLINFVNAYYQKIE